TTVRQARARQPWLKALYTVDAGAPPERRDPDTDDFIAAPFERCELLGCVFELLQLVVGGARVGGRRPAALGDEVALRIIRCKLFQLGKPDGSIDLREEFAGAYRGQRHRSRGACPIAGQLLGLAP